MTTAIDTNVVIALWDKDATLSLAAQPHWMRLSVAAHWSPLLLCSRS